MIDTLYPAFRHWSAKGSVWIISDTHFEDEDCKLMDPNWPTSEEYINGIRGISKNDTVIHLGDVGNPVWMDKIKGYKVLIMGNHDESASRFTDYFDEVYTGPLIIAEKILLSHEPILHYGFFNIHGHNHNICSHYTNHMNCAANVVNYKKINLKTDIIDKGYLKNVKSIHRTEIDETNAVKILKEYDQYDYDFM